ncbi:OLC1v1014603C1 [Oldenlandia corymbosa var. corymbosa]|uniref:OLC1v1014603C1 n=1 Tax=Oldenlandia corymbosa var. corymbosa TaxID=529605 RepID=A0AAV1E117_OLDCO|nr:OLC1v1014603C1 [Oldenlandia corymbosa var. corymbosa]
MRSSRRLWDQFFKRFRPSPSRPFCTSNKSDKPNSGNTNNGTDVGRDFDVEEASSSISRQEAYKKLENLDFMTATKILFTTPPKRKKFGLDFHLVQLFFACLPSFAVYLVAQYARSEMRRMEAELEVKKKAEEEAKAKAEEEEKAKEMELKAAERQKDPQILEVKERLNKLEEAIKEIANESKKKTTDSGENSEAEKVEAKQYTAGKPENIGTDARHSTSHDTSGKGA